MEFPLACHLGGAYLYNHLELIRSSMSSLDPLQTTTKKILTCMVVYNIILKIKYNWMQKLVILSRQKISFWWNGSRLQYPQNSISIHRMREYMGLFLTVSFFLSIYFDFLDFQISQKINALHFLSLTNEG